MNRTIGLALTLVLVVASAAVGWFAGTRIKSPAQVAAETAPPEPSPIAVPVESMTLSNDVIVRGTIAFEELQSFELDSPPATEDGVSIVTDAPPDRGDLLEEGAVAVEVSDRPVFVLVGELPAFRTIRPGVEGDDVLQLEEALDRLGLAPGPVDGVYDELTEAGVTALYQQAGYSPRGSSPEEQQQLDDARDAVDAAQASLMSAQAQLRAAGEGASESSIISAEAQLEAARRNLANANADAEALGAQAAAELATAQDGAAAAAKALETATDRLAQAEAGAHPDTGEPPTEEELAELRAAVDAARAAKDDADAVVEDAEAGVTQAERAAVETVASAQADFDVAEASLAEIKEKPSTTFERQAVTAAQDSLADAKADLAELEAQVGVVVPKSELVFFETLPLSVEDVSVERGDFVAGTLMQLTGSDLKITASVPLTDFDLVQVGAPVVLEDDVFELELAAEVRFKADGPGTNGVDDQRVYIELEALEDIPPELIGASVKITIPVQSTGGDVLVVPVAALSATASDDVRVEKLTGDDSSTFVEVRRGLAAGGMVEVEALDGSLAEGDLVVVGFER